MKKILIALALLTTAAVSYAANWYSSTPSIETPAETEDYIRVYNDSSKDTIGVGGSIPRFA